MFLFFRPFQAQNVFILFLKVLKFSMFSDGVNRLHMSWYYVYCRVPELQINKQLYYTVVTFYIHPIVMDKDFLLFIFTTSSATVYT